MHEIMVQVKDKNKHKNKAKGMTLLEVTVTLVLSSLFFGCVMQFMVTGTKFYIRTRERQQLRLAMNQVMRVIEEQYEEAAQICVYVRKNETDLDSLIDCIHVGHNLEPITSEDYANHYLHRMDYYMPKEMYGTMENNEEKIEKKIINLVEKEKDGEKLFKIAFQGQTLINNYLKIKINVANQHLILDLTVFNEAGEYLEDRLKLDLRYKL